MQAEEEQEAGAEAEADAAICGESATGRVPKSPAAVVTADGLNDYIAATEERLDAMEALPRREGEPAS